MLRETLLLSDNRRSIALVRSGILKKEGPLRGGMSVPSASHERRFQGIRGILARVDGRFDGLQDSLDLDQPDRVSFLEEGPADGLAKNSIRFTL
jgi:hypothetical protein